MKTLIELWDERPIENVLAVDVFKPSTVVYLCPTEIAQNKKAQNVVRDFIASRNKEIKVEFFESSKYDTKKVISLLRKITAEHEDCVIDITGGTDNMLFASGIVCHEKDVAAFTYSHDKNMFYNIIDAPFADNIECKDIYRIEDFIKMAGGKIRQGRVNDASLDSHLDYVEPLFCVFLEYKTKWSKIVSWFQHASQDNSLEVKNAPLKYMNGKKVSCECPEECLRKLEKSDIIKNLKFKDEKASFTFTDKQLRFWLRDVGSALEIFTYKKAKDSGIFSEYKSSVVVDWENDDERDKICNEIDLMAVSGLTPYFISCKACKVNTYALNELEILRDRFGGKGAVAMLVTTEKCSGAAKKRAQALNIVVADIDDIKKEVKNG